MGKLTLSLDGNVIQEIELQKERYTLGRLPDNDIRVDNLAVSGHHALIINILKDSFLEDLNSTNGTYVNGKLVKKHALKDGDVIAIGKHQLKYAQGGAQSASADDDEGADEFEKTMIIRPGSKSQAGVPSMDSVNKAMAAAGAAPISDQQAKPGALPSGKLQVLSGAFAGRELELNKALTTLGRPGVQVAAITRRADGFFIVPVESTDGKAPMLNSAPIGQAATKLKNNDVIEIAGVKMGFFAT